MPDCSYIGRALVEFALHYQGPQLRIYLTWDVDYLPTYGRNVVAILVGDEWCRTPSYARRVLAVFKCFGLALTLPKRDSLSWLFLMELLHVSRMAVRKSFDRIRLGMYGDLDGANIWDIPLGYYRQKELPIVPIANRLIDVAFAGSVQRQSRFSLRDIFRSPKTISRDQMLRVMQIYKADNPKRRVELSVTDSFQASIVTNADLYSSMLQQTKICLVPRGSSLETYRWFEGIRYGCVVVCEHLPRRRYYEGSPAIEVRDWNRLPELLNRLLDDPAILAQKHALALKWWQEMCSEEIVGEWIHSKVVSCIHDQGPIINSHVGSDHMSNAWPTF